MRHMQEGGAVNTGPPSQEPDEEDLTDQYNTPLTPEEEQRYQQWAQQNKRTGDTFDYDMRGAWKEGIAADPSTGHFPDTYKKPNHPTFSDQSMYHGANGRMGGHWQYDETGQETLLPYQPDQGQEYENHPQMTNEERARNEQIVREMQAGKKFPLYQASPRPAPRPEEIMR